jgi:hypothetical protein
VHSVVEASPEEKMITKHRSSVFSAMSAVPLFIAAGSALLVGCKPQPQIKDFSVNPRIFCPPHDVQVRWATQDANRVEVALGEASMTVAGSGETTFPNVTSSGVVQLTAFNDDLVTWISQDITAFTGHYPATFTTSDCLVGGAPFGQTNIDTSGMRLLVVQVSGAPLPLSVSHDETHRHPSEPFEVWHLKQMAGPWSVTGDPQPGRACSGSTNPGSPPEPKTLSMTGSCSGQLGDGPQSVMPPPAVSLSAAQRGRLRCNGEFPTPGVTAGRALWIRQPSGCVTTEAFSSDSIAEAVQCARAQAKDVVGSVAEVAPPPVSRGVNCGSGCQQFFVTSDDDYNRCAAHLCPDGVPTVCTP